MAQTSLVAAVLRGTTAGLNLLLTWTLTHLLSLEQFGRYSFTMALVGFLTVLVQYGTTLITLREIAGLSDDDDGTVKIASVLYSSVGIILLLGSISIFGVMALKPYFYSSGLSWAERDFLEIGLPIIVIVALLNIPISSLQGRRKIVLSLFGELIRPVAVIAVLVSIIWTGTHTPTASTALFAQICGTMIITVTMWALLARTLPAAVFSARPSWRVGAWVRQGATIMCGSALQFIVVRADLVLLGMIAGATTIGLYAPAAAIVLAVSLGQAGVNITYGPSIAAHRDRGSRDDLKKLTRKASFMASLFAVPPVLALVLFPEPILSLFGDAYTQSAAALVILSISQFIAAAFGISVVTLNMLKLERLVLVALIAAATSQLAFGAILIPALSMTGAALSNLAAMFTFIFLSTLFVRRNIGYWIVPDVVWGLGQLARLVQRNKATISDSR